VTIPKSIATLIIDAQLDLSIMSCDYLKIKEHKMKLTFIGHAAVSIELNNFKAIIDPFITYNPQATISVEDIKELTHIFITHGHGDHIGDAVELAKKFDALIITNFEIANHLASQGVKTHGMHIGGRHSFDFGTVKMTHAVHGSGIQTDSGVVDGGNPGGFVITIDGKTIYHAGDTGLTLDMQLLEDELIDVAFLPIGGNYTMDYRDAVKATTFIKAKNIVPIHYNTFPIIETDPIIFKTQVTASEVIILGPGESITI
jgi:L-ascorbate metabolism protein UlaG (beta-lactamase superfamily)